MRIAFIHNLPSGGGKRSAYEFVKHMTKSHTVDLYYIDEASEEYLDLRKLVDRAVLVPGPKPKSGVGVLTTLVPARRAYAEIAQQVNRGGYDLAFVMQCKLSNSPFVLKYLQIPSLYFCHEPLTKLLEPHFWTGVDHKFVRRAVVGLKIEIDRINARHATLICANSRYSVENIYRSYGVYPRYVQLGVDAHLFRPLSLERERVVLSVGQLQPAKAQDLIIEAVGTLRERPVVHFIHNSSARGYKARLQQVAERCGVSISFSQLVNDDDLVKAYNRAALVAFPSYLEPLGFVPLEAMACGTPVVGVAEGGIRETVEHGTTGILSERNPADFGRAIEMLLRDESLSERMGMAGRRHVVEHWTWKESFAMLDRNLLELHSRRRAGEAKRGDRSGVRIPE